MSGVSSGADASTGSADTARARRVTNMENGSSLRAAKTCMEVSSQWFETNCCVATHPSRAET